MYIISRIPAVLTINSTTNHPSWLLRPAFHKAIPFQIKDQISNTISKKIKVAPIPNNDILFLLIHYLVYIHFVLFRLCKTFNFFLFPYYPFPFVKIIPEHLFFVFCRIRNSCSWFNILFFANFKSKCFG